MNQDNSERRKIEAVLYTTGKYMTPDEIAQACGIGSIGYIKDEIKALQEEYKTKDSALEIQEHEGRYKLNIKKEYGFLANKLLGDGELDGPATKTLAIIAYKSPVMQNEVIHMRGNKAYDHIRQLKEEGLVTSERHGRTRQLRTTTKFYEYFDISKEQIKTDFANMEDDVRKKAALKMGTTQEAVEELEKRTQEFETQQKENEKNEDMKEEIESFKDKLTITVEAPKEKTAEKEEKDVEDPAPTSSEEKHSQIFEDDTQ